MAVPWGKGDQNWNSEPPEQTGLGGKCIKLSKASSSLKMGEKQKLELSVCQGGRAWKYPRLSQNPALNQLNPILD